MVWLGKKATKKQTYEAASWTKTREGAVNRHGYGEAVDRHQTERPSKRWAMIRATPFLVEVLGDLSRSVAVEN